MAGPCRLDTLAPEVAAALRGASPELQRRVARFAAVWAITRTGLIHPALAGDSADIVSALVSELDERYFALSEARASSEDVEAAFGQARAANAVEFVLRDEPADTIYEAAAAVEDWSELRASVLSLLGEA